MTAQTDPLDPTLINRGLECARCGYDLRGNECNVCPECGLPFDPDAIPPANVPWLRRRKLGILTAYYTTVWRALIHPADFGEQVWRVVDVQPADTLAFARLTVWIATASIVVFALWLKDLALGGEPIGPAALKTLLVATPTAFVFFSIASLRLAINPKVGTREHQIRFARMQHFACAGLGLMPAVVAAILITSAIALFSGPRAEELNWIVSLTFFSVLMTWWLGGAMFHHYGGRLNGDRLIGYTALTLILWALAFVAALMTHTAAFWATEGIR